MKSIIVGTAGHIDHGKSALVRALTGKDPDRLPEEKRRGITIDLGFADLQLEGVKIGFVDVPGHEKFIKNMLAGAHGIDVLALVIAADEGVMPQTREHFDICRLLGIQNGLIVITKSDLVESELLPLVIDEAKELVKGSFLEGSPILCVSAKTGAGLDELRVALKQSADHIPALSSDFVMRLPIDRVFTMKGFGAVITGTLVAGLLKEGDELELMPTERRVRARGIQLHGRSVSTAAAGNRTAVNLGGIEVGSIERGMVLAPLDRLRPTQVLDVKIEVLSGASKPLRSRARIRMHVHAAEILGRVRVLNEEGVIAPGTEGFAQLRLESPVVATLGERFILRSYSPAQTIAGGSVIDPCAGKHRGRDFDQARRRLNILSDSNSISVLREFVAGAGDAGLKPADIAARTGWSDSLLSKNISEAVAQKTVIDCEGVLVEKERFDRLARLATEAVNLHHQREPLSKGLAREALREKIFAHLPQEVFRSVLSALERAKVVVAEKEIVRAAGHELSVTGEDAKLRDQLAGLFEQARLEPPTIESALLAIGLSKTQAGHGRKILQLLLDSGTVLRINNDLVFHQQALSDLKSKLKSYGDAHEPSRLIDVATFKELAGVSRKYAIPLLEYLDRERITRRAGEQRIISK